MPPSALTLSGLAPPRLWSLGPWGALWCPQHWPGLCCSTLPVQAWQQHRVLPGSRVKASVQELCSAQLWGHPHAHLCPPLPSTERVPSHWLLGHPPSAMCALWCSLGRVRMSSAFRLWAVCFGLAHFPKVTAFIPEVNLWPSLGTLLTMESGMALGRPPAAFPDTTGVSTCSERQRCPSSEAKPSGTPHPM